MLKKLIMSGLVLGGIVATVSAGSYAAFTDTGTATGTVSAATVDILLNGSDGTVAVAFAPAGNIIPGGSSTQTVTVYNNGSVPVNVSQLGLIAISEVSDPGADCLPASVSAVAAGLPISGLAPGGSANFTVTFTLDIGAGNECQGTQWQIDTTVEATT